MDSVETIVVGAGVIGLAVARELARSGREVVVLESQYAIGTATSSRNSEVLHAGLYYEPGSLKARLCVDGRRRLVDYCRDHGVTSRLLGKLIVAADSTQLAAVESIERRAIAAGVEDLRWLDRSAVRELEPTLDCHAALWSPSSGILDSHALMLALRGNLEDQAGAVALRSRLIGGEVAGDGFRLLVDADGVTTEVACRELVNAAGLGAQQIAHSLSGLDPASIPPLFLAKGSYFTLVPSSPFAHLVYPVPVEGGLGVHLTLDLAGRARFGPDVEWVSEIDYAVDARRAGAFEAAIRRYWPGLPERALLPAYAGIRPKLSGPGEPPGDFRIDGAHHHGIAGLVNLFGLESPGLTASLAIAARVRAELDYVK